MAEEDSTTNEGDEPVAPDEAQADAAEGVDTLAKRAEDRAIVHGTTPAALGATKYVHAAFFGAGILVAYLAGRILTAVWNSLAAWAPAVRAVPQLLRYAEDERPTFTMAAGALVGLVVVVQTYRREGIREWADEVAAELSKVVWPTRDMVLNGTIVVIVATAITTAYVGLLDQLWAFITMRVYGT